MAALLSSIALPFFIPLICAIVYPVGTLLMKRAMEKGADLWTTLAVNYWAMALVFLSVIPLESGAVPWHLWYQPVAVGLLSFLGQGCALKGVSSGDLTIATPALGSKVLLVALLTETMLREQVPLMWWIAAASSFAAVFFLQAGAPGGRRRTAATLAYSLAAASFFSLGDVLIQKWAPRWGAFHFLPAMALASAVYSLALLPFMRRPVLAFEGGGGKWLAGGALLLGAQSLMLTGVIAVAGQATLVNIVFSSRGLWNFLIIRFLGDWFRNREREAGPKVMAARLAGAGLMFAAIVLVSIRW